MSLTLPVPYQWTGALIICRKPKSLSSLGMKGFVANAGASLFIRWQRVLYTVPFASKSLWIAPSRVLQMQFVPVLKALKYVQQRLLCGI